MTTLRVSTAAALIAAAIGIGVQIAAGADYPVVPPGAIILLVAAAVGLWWRRRAALSVPIVAAVFLLVGSAIAPNARDNLAAGSGRMWGTLLQFAALVVALVVAVTAVVRERPAR